MTKLPIKSLDDAIRDNDENISVIADGKKISIEEAKRRGLITKK